jgi:hypothetical protein
MTAETPGRMITRVGMARAQRLRLMAVRFMYCLPILCWGVSPCKKAGSNGRMIYWVILVVSRSNGKTPRHR